MNSYENAEINYSCYQQAEIDHLREQVKTLREAREVLAAIIDSTDPKCTSMGLGHYLKARAALEATRED